MNIEHDYQDALEMVGGDRQAAATLVLAMYVGNVADALHRLGNADASTPMGAIEALGGTILSGAETIAEALRD